VHVVGQIGERDLGLGALDADGADKQPHLVFQPGKDVFDAGADLRFGGIGLGGPLGHGPASGLPAMDAADPALPFEPCLIGLAAIGGIGPDIGGGVVAGDDIAEHPPVKACTIGDLAFTDEAERAADRDAALVAKAWDGDVDPRLAFGGGPGFGELQRPARVGVLLCCPGGFIGPDLTSLLPALIASFSGAVLRCFGAATRVASTICPPMAR
jgi:hypothetical protein